MVKKIIIFHHIGKKIHIHHILIKIIIMNIEVKKKDMIKMIIKKTM